MKKHPTDKFFAEKLKEVEIKPRPEAWDKLQMRMQTKQRRIGGWWQQGPWLAAAGVSLVLVAGWVIWSLNQSPDLTVAHKETNKSMPPQKQTIPLGESNKIPSSTDTDAIAALAEIPKEPTDKEVEKRNIRSSVPQKDARQSEPTILESLALQSSQEVAVNENKTPERENVNIAPTKVEQPQLIAQNSPTSNQPVTKTVVLQLPELKQSLVASAQVESNVEKQSADNVEKQKSDNEDFGENLLNKPRKSTRMTKVWQQLKNAKNGEKVDWEEVGFNPNKVLAKATGKNEN
ncbi:hypothetical protein P1X15_28885 [Runella sp. MFBS21]|uniref:hypothetical protein n=1 Tax=Runella sp. MFBS21 TaxID=3034018 RepID=UPI0023F9069B|nr:hypothetical protein [Runella sp. MFBS21]MDF7821667.1 hypothetical protein [Runella sp. MFBS21]